MNNINRKALRYIGGNDFMQVLASEQYGGPPEETIYNAKQPDMRGMYMMDLVRQWGMVTNDAGRPLDPADVVARATEITHRVFTQMDDAGWLVAMDRNPPVAPVSMQLAEREEADGNPSEAKFIPS